MSPVERVSPTPGPTSELSFANCKILSNHSSSPDSTYLPAGGEGDRTMEHSP